MDKTELESKDMAKLRCSVCSKSEGGILTLNNKKYCRGHYNNELKKLRDSLVISLIKSLEEQLETNPKMLNDIDKKTIAALKDTYQESRFGKSKSDIEKQLKGLSKEELIEAIIKSMIKK